MGHFSPVCLPHAVNLAVAPPSPFLQRGKRTRPVAALAQSGLVEHARLRTRRWGGGAVRSRGVTRPGTSWPIFTQAGRRAAWGRAVPHRPRTVPGPRRKAPLGTGLRAGRTLSEPVAAARTQTPPIGLPHQPKAAEVLPLRRGRCGAGPRPGLGRATCCGCWRPRCDKLRRLGSAAGGQWRPSRSRPGTWRT